MTHIIDILQLAEGATERTDEDIDRPLVAKPIFRSRGVFEEAAEFAVVINSLGDVVVARTTDGHDDTVLPDEGVEFGRDSRLGLAGHLATFIDVLGNTRGSAQCAQIGDLICESTECDR